MDFYQIKERESNQKGVLEVYADFQVYADSGGTHSKDLMIRGGKFYAVWDESKGLWSTSELDAARLIDRDIRAYEPQGQSIEVRRRYLKNWGSNTWQQFRLFCTTLPDTPADLDQKIAFANTEVTKEDRATFKLPYSMAEGDISAYEELVSKLYTPEQRAKFEWAMGAIITGDSKAIQKALVFFGKPGEGKSTILDLFEDMFDGYFLTFDVSEIVSSSSQFGLAPFKDNKLVAIDQDGDLSKIDDNARLNKLIAHDKLRINEKHQKTFDIRPVAMSLVGTNKPVRITDAKSGLIRRIIDVRPTGELHTEARYRKLVQQVRFELGAIAYHAVEVYKKMGRDYYSGYVPTDMMAQTNVFFNYIEAYYDTFEMNDGTTLKQAWELWKGWLDETNTKWDLAQHRFRDELKSYFDKFEERPLVDGVRVRNWYSGFNAAKFKTPLKEGEPQPTAEIFSLVLEETTSLFDQLFKDAPAQYARTNEQGNTQPDLYWDDSKRINKDGKEFFPRPDQVVSTCLRDLDTSVEHYVRVPENHIVIDFDIRDSFGQKSPEKNLAAASSWPPTYAEYSKSGGGVHLHYDYVGRAEDLVRVFGPGIEVKVFTGYTALRRRLTLCNNVPIAQISSGLRVKEKQVIDTNVVANEQHLRNRIAKALRKEVHDNTKSNMDYIHHVLQEAYNDKTLEYDVTDMRPHVMKFALASTNQKDACLKMMQTMQFKSEETDVDPTERPNVPNEEKPVIFDVECFPNLFVVCWKYSGSDQVVAMVNPSAREVEALLSLKLIGFNNRGYDNHMMYGAMLGYNNRQLFELSQALIDNSPNAKFREAYNLSFTDIFDFASKKQTLKKWEIELGIKHLELGLPWDQPVPEDLWDKVIEYCKNDVHATDAVFQHLKADYIAREILATITGLSMNSTTQQHAARLVFGENRKPQGKFHYEDLSRRFPGYKHEYNPDKKAMLSTYRGEEVGEGGLVRAKPGIWENVYLFDIESMHPTSIEILNLFGEYTQNFSEIKAMRVAIKEGRLEDARQMFGGKLAPFLSDEEVAEALSYALKIVINIVYGLTAAGFDNAFRDPRNVDNIVAKIGALFMVDLMYEIEARGFDVIHVKTDSIKVPSPTPELIDFIMEYGRAFGYKFVHEATYSKMCLVNDAVYVAQVGWAAKKSKIGTWDTVGAQFAHPYVKKTLFTKQPIEFKDMCEARSVRTSLWLDFEGEDVPMALNDEHKVFVGKTGLFVPIVEGAGGGLLVREKDGKYSAATATTGYRWLEAETVQTLGKEDDIDMTYFQALVDKAIANIERFGSFSEFVSNDFGLAA